MLVVFRVGGYPKPVERQVRDLTRRFAASTAASASDAAETVWDDLAQMQVRAQRRRRCVLKAAVPFGRVDAPGRRSWNAA